MNWFFVICLALALELTSGEELKWSLPEYARQAKSLTCIPKEHFLTKSILIGKDGNFTHLGKVDGIQVCGILCCEVESCDLALLQDKHCYAVKCSDLTSCDMPQGEGPAEIATFRRKSGSDIWSTGDQSNKNGAPLYPKNKTTVITKQAAAVQKSVIPEITTVTNEAKSSIIALSNKEHAESPMEALLKKESLMVRNKQLNQNESAKKAEVKTAQVGEKIQDVTDHYLKTEEKSDMTALQENETSSIHPKFAHRRQDLKHTLISPITIGAFTCMAVIAVSGFAMAIIKYQRERKEYEDKQTQKP